MLSMIRAAGVPSHAKLPSNGRCPLYAAMLTTSIGKKTRKPVAAASPIPSTIDSGRSKSDMEEARAKEDMMISVSLCPFRPRYIGANFSLERKCDQVIHREDRLAAHGQRAPHRSVRWQR